MNMKCNVRRWLLSLAMIFIVAHSSILQAAEFDAMVVPSLMDSSMDAWYKVPADSGPNIHKTSKVYRDQQFNLLIFFKGYSADQENNVHISYDMQILDPQGKPSGDKNSDLLAYQGPMGNPNVLILNQQYPTIAFTDDEPLGTYTIKVTAFDKVSGKTFASDTPVELVAFSLGDKFASQKEVSEWIKGYHTNPTPIKAIAAVREFIQLDGQWLNKNTNILWLFRRIFADNPFLLKHLAGTFGSLSIDDQKKMLIVAAIAGDKSLEPQLATSAAKDLNQFYQAAKRAIFPDVSGEITTPVQLDILWAEFLATGRYEPIRKIVSALALHKYTGSIELLQIAGKDNATDEMKKKAYLEATYKAAVWSLISNCVQIPLVFKYCEFMLDKEGLHDDTKGPLETLLGTARKEINKKQEPDTPKS